MQAVSNQIKVVLAEDDEAIAEAYRLGLGYHGFAIEVAADGREAITAIERQIPDILLLDIIMPNMNGLEVLEILRANEAHKNLPVIVLTNLGQRSDAERVQELGAKAYLIKANLSLKDLVQQIYDALDGTKLTSVG
jgi:two-component system phosphate regulon response regulator PhoB